MSEDLMEEVVESSNARRALEAVQRNRGAAGLDKMTTGELREHLERHWEVIRGKLLAGSYKPVPVLRVTIPKPGGGRRKLGIPTVMDRFVQHLLLQVLSPIFEERFSDHSYGFRPGRSAHDAVRRARKYVRSGRDWVVDLDIEEFFDQVQQDILMQRIGEVIRDKRVLRLIGRYLRCGVMVDGAVLRSARGTPQGGPLSPLLANIYLDPLDRELESRGHCFVRYADDCNVYVGSQASAQRLLGTLPRWIDKHLRLKVNATKSGAGRPWERKFLGFGITRQGEIEVSAPSLLTLKKRVRQLWCGRQSLTSVQLRQQWQRYIRGWWNYYRLAQWRRPVTDLEGWMRRHMRKCFYLRWHSWRGRQRALRGLGVSEGVVRSLNSGRGAWRLSRHPAMNQGLNNATLRRYGFLVPSDLAG